MFSPSVPVVVALVAVLVATVTDLWLFKIHNLLTLPLLASGLVYHGTTGGSANSLFGALFGFGALFPFYALGGMGGGDVKLAAGIGAWLGMPLTFWVLVVASLAAGLYSAVLIVTAGRFCGTWTRPRLVWDRVAAVRRRPDGGDRIEKAVRCGDRRLVPFGAMMGVGLLALLAFAWLRPTP